MTSVAMTESGIVCGKCSHGSGKGRILVRHASVTAVRLCQTTPAADTTPVGGSWAGTSEPTVVVKIGTLPPVPGTERQAPASVDPEKVVPAGRYAIRGTDGTVRFYVVDRPTEGRWAGYTFVKVQAGSELHNVKDRARRIGILAGIFVDPRGASVLYGRELGVCGVCGRTLTDETSRANGIGPVCAGRF